MLSLEQNQTQSRKILLKNYYYTCWKRFWVFLFHPPSPILPLYRFVSRLNEIIVSKSILNALIELDCMCVRLIF